MLAGSVDRVALERAVASLPPGYRMVFVLHDVEGFEHNEIATMLECSTGNSKSQLHKGAPEAPRTSPPAIPDRPDDREGGLAMSEHDAQDPKPTNGAAQPDDLHNLFATEEEDPLAQMRDDPNYGALIKELEYIAAEARRLFDPVEEAPSDKVWEGIQKGLSKPTDA